MLLQPRCLGTSRTLHFDPGPCREPILGLGRVLPSGPGQELAPGPGRKVAPGPGLGKDPNQEKVLFG